MFLHIPELISLELNEQWKKAVEMLIERWMKSKNDVQILLRLLSECWYVLMLWDCCISDHENDFLFFFSELKSSIIYGDNHFKNDPFYLATTGYFMVTTPYLFVYDSTKKDDMVEIEGKNRLEKALLLSPDYPFGNVLYSGYVNDLNTHRNVQKRFSQKLSELDWDDSAVEKYFQEILFENTLTKL